MKHCPNCGESYDEREKFCERDGTPLAAADETVAGRGGRQASPWLLGAAGLAVGLSVCAVALLIYYFATRGDGAARPYVQPAGAPRVAEFPPPGGAAPESPTPESDEATPTPTETPTPTPRAPTPAPAAPEGALRCCATPPPQRTRSRANGSSSACMTARTSSPTTRGGRRTASGIAAAASSHCSTPPASAQSSGNSHNSSSSKLRSHEPSEGSPGRRRPRAKAEGPRPGGFLIGVDLVDLFFDQREQALAESMDQRVGLFHVLFEPEAALRSLVQQAFNPPPLVLQHPPPHVAQSGVRVEPTSVIARSMLSGRRSSSTCIRRVLNEVSFSISSISCFPDFGALFGAA